MRTRFEVVLADQRDPAGLRAAGEEALDEIARVEQELSAFRPDSILARINAEAAERPVLLDGVTFGFLERCARLVDATDGAFDPTVGALLALLRRAAPATNQEWAAARERVGFRAGVRLDGEAGTVRFARAGVRLDPGAIGKGWALERAAEILRDAGIEAALLHGGTSTVYALGAPPGEAGWRVAVQDPLVPEGRLGEVLLRDRALGVSAIYGRAYARGAERVGHVLDPRTGQAVAHTVLAAAVTVSPTDADATATALLVLGAGALGRMGELFPDASFLVATAAGEGLRLERAGEAFGAPGRSRARAARRARAPRRVP